MKKILFLSLFALTPLLSNAQENYFHDLKGMEDSDGVTHLFYRMYDSWQTECISNDGWEGTLDLSTNHVYHFNAETKQDSIKLRDDVTANFGCDYITNQVNNFVFTASHPDSILAIKSLLQANSALSYVEFKTDDKFDIGAENPNGISFDYTTNRAVITTPFNHQVPKVKDNFEASLQKSFWFDRNDASLFQYNSYAALPDSMFIDFTVTGVSPLKEGMYVGFKDASIVLSNDYGANFSTIATHYESFYDNEFHINETVFDADYSSFYMLLDKTYLVRKEASEWDISTIEHDYFSIDQDRSGHFYFSKENSLFLSTDFGTSNQLISTLPQNITGLYKKPGSEILYVLTTEELFSIENGDVSTLKTLPVSNELEPTTLPDEITLHQNYPNPFNPTTVIGFQLPKSGVVKLDVFDMLGRKVATLVDDKMAPGNHEITFDATNFSSGVYLYRLQTGQFSKTRQFTLIK